MRYVMCTAFALPLISTTSAISAETNSVQHYLVKVALQEIPPAGSKQPGIVLAEPQVMVVANREANLSIGGQGKIGENKIPFGTLFKVNVTQINGNKVRVTGVLDVSSVGTLADDVMSRASFSVHFDKTVDLGNKTRICVSKSSDKERWFELLIDEPKNLHAGNSAQPSAGTEPVARNPSPRNRGRDMAK